MKKTLVLILLAIVLVSCNFPGSEAHSIDDDVVATAVAETMIAEGVEEAMTPTPISVDGNEDDQEAAPTEEAEVPTETPEPSATVEPTETPTITPTATVTNTPLPDDEDPLSWLGNPGWSADFNGGGDDDGGFYTDDDEQTTIEVDNDALAMTHHLTTVGWHTWSLNYRTLQDFYFEAEVNIKECSGVDEYGLVFRGPDYSSGYFFSLRCNGEYSLRAYDGEYENILYWQYSDAINSGAHQSNRLGVWAEGDTYRLYINGEMIKEFTDGTFTGSGHYGFLIAGYETPGFRVEIDRARTWQQ